MARSRCPGCDLVVVDGLPACPRCKVEFERRKVEPEAKPVAPSAASRRAARALRYAASTRQVSSAPFTDEALAGLDLSLLKALTDLALKISIG